MYQRIHENKICLFHAISAGETVCRMLHMYAANNFHTAGHLGLLPRMIHHILDRHECGEYQARGDQSQDEHDDMPNQQLYGTPYKASINSKGRLRPDMWQIAGMVSHDALEGYRSRRNADKYYCRVAMLCVVDVPSWVHDSQYAHPSKLGYSSHPYNPMYAAKHLGILHYKSCEGIVLMDSDEWMHRNDRNKQCLFQDSQVEEMISHYGFASSYVRIPCSNRSVQIFRHDNGAVLQSCHTMNKVSLPDVCVRHLDKLSHKIFDLGVCGFQKIDRSFHISSYLILYHKQCVIAMEVRNVRAKNI